VLGGRLWFFTGSRAEIGFAVMRCAKYSINPGTLCWYAFLWMLRNSKRENERIVGTGLNREMLSLNAILGTRLSVESPISTQLSE